MSDEEIDMFEASSPEPTVPSVKPKSPSDGEVGEGGAELSPKLNPSSPKRQRTLAVRTRDDTSPNGTRTRQIEVEIPSSRLHEFQPKPASQSQEDSPRSRPDSPGAEPTSATKQLEVEADERLASQSIEPEPEPAIAPQPQPTAESKHVVFGDDDDVENYVTAAADPAKEPKSVGLHAQDEEDKSDDDDDDDDAPEAFSTKTAAQETLRSAKVVSDAADKHAATLKRKRQERDDLFRKQAEKRRRTRKRKTDQAKAAGSGDEISEGEGEGEGEDGDASQGARIASTSKRWRAGKSDVPDLLPPELLTDSESEGGDDGSALRKIKAVTTKGKQKPTKIRFEDVVQTLNVRSKAPRDEVVGTTHYRILEEERDPRLAPLSNRQSYNAKQRLLQRRRARVITNKKQGFFLRR